MRRLAEASFLMAAPTTPQPFIQSCFSITILGPGIGKKVITIKLFSMIFDDSQNAEAQGQIKIFFL